MKKEDNGELPEGWTTARLVEVATLQRGYDLPVQDRAAGSIPVLGGNGEVGRHNSAMVKGPGVVTGRSGTIGKVLVVEQDFWPLNTSLFVVDFHGNDHRFVALLLQHLNLEQYHAGTGVPTLNRNVVHEVEVPLPPLAEQRRIVAAVEAVLAKVNAARDRLNRVPAILKRFRQAVLSAACSGRLTADWRGKNLKAEPAHRIVERITEETVYQERRGRRKEAPRDAPAEKSFWPAAVELIDQTEELPDSWCWAEFGDLVVNHDSARVPVKQSDRDNRHGDYPYYGAFGIIDQIDSFIYDGDYLLVAEDGKNLESRLRPIAFHATGRFWVNNHAHVLQACGGIALEYLKQYLNSPVLTLASFLTGIDQVKLNREAMDRIPVPLPPLNEQQEIVRRGGELFALADRVETRLADARQMADQLTQAVLAKAFRGELVPTEADLARRENRTYEPGDKLLERIQLERASVSVNGTTRPARKRSAPSKRK